MAPATLGVICPCYQEAAGIARFWEELAAALDQGCQDLDWHVAFVDDGSTDGTLDVLHQLARRDRRVRVFALTRNFGHQVALSAGLDLVRADAVVMMDADLQHPPALVPRMVELWRAGHDVVSAVRDDTADAGLLKRWTSRAFYAVFNALSDVKLTPGVADFTLLSRRAHEALLTLPERHRCLRAMVAWLGLRRALVPFVAPARAAGRSSYTMRRMVGLAVDAVLSFSARPIRLATKLGVLVAGAGFLYLMYVVGRAVLIGDTVAGWPSVLSMILILGGTQLVFIGLCGEYLARVFEEAKGRPLYVLAERPDAESRQTAAVEREPRAAKRSSA